MSELLFDGMALTVEVGFSTTAGAGRVPINGNLTDITWTDITEHVREVSTSRGRSSELDSFTTGSASIVLSNADRHFDPEHAPYVTLPGTSGNFLSGGEINAWPSASDLSVRVKVKATNLATTSFGAFCGNTNQASTGFRFYTGNGVARLGIAWWDTGTGGFRSVVANADNPTTTDIIWVRVDVDRDNGAGGNDVWFYYSTDGITWTLIGTKVTTATVATPGYNPALGQNFGLGSQKGDAFRNGLSGNYYQAVVYTDLTETTKVVDYTATGFTSNTDSTMVASTGETWTVNKSGASPATVVSGPYYGNLTPLRPIRIRVTPSGGTIRSIFFGFIDQWPQAYNYPNDATVAVTATDAFKVLNEFKLPSYWNTTITNDAPTAWYRLSDFAGSPNGFEVVQWNAFSGQWRGAVETFSTCTPSESLLVDDPAKSSAFDGNKWFQAWDVLGTEAALGGIAQTDEWTVEMWITTTAANNGNYAIFNHGNFIHGGTIGMVVDVQGRGFITAQFGNRGSSNAMVAKGSGLVVNDGKPHHIAIAYRSNPSFGNTFNLYVDGQLATSESSYYDVIETDYQSLSLGYPIAKSATVESNFDRYFIGSIQEFVVWTSLLDGTTIVKHYQTGAGTYLQGTRTDERITLLANLAGWMSDGLDLNTGDSTVLGVQTTGKGLLDALKEVETAEQGRLFMSVDGKIRFIDRNAEGTGNFITSQATFSDNPGVGEIKYSDITLTYDDRYIFNEVTVTQPNGTTFTASDTTSQGKYFKRTLNIDNFTADTGYFVANTALYRLQQYKNPQMRIDELTVNARRAVAYQSPCVTLDIGDRITVERTPQDVGTQISKTLIIEGIKHSITRDNWVVTFTTSPTLENAPFVLDSATLGVLDTDLLAY